MVSKQQIPEECDFGKYVLLKTGEGIVSSYTKKVSQATGINKSELLSLRGVASQCYGLMPHFWQISTTLKTFAIILIVNVMLIVYGQSIVQVWVKSWWTKIMIMNLAS